MLEKISNKKRPSYFIIAIINSCHKKKEYAFSVGINDYLTNPTIPAELLIRIKSCLYYCRSQDYQSLSNLEFISRLGCEENPTVNSCYSIINQEKHTSLVQKTCHYLLSNLSVNKSLDELSQLMATNRNTLWVSFKQVLGTSVYSWLRVQRMQKAQTLLKTTDLSIQEISYQVGYNNPANFSTSYKSLFKKTPKQYRNEMMKSKL